MIYIDTMINTYYKIKTDTDTIKNWAEINVANFEQGTDHDVG